MNFLPGVMTLAKKIKGKKCLVLYIINKNGEKAHSEERKAKTKLFLILHGIPNIQIKFVELWIYPNNG